MALFGFAALPSKNVHSLVICDRIKGKITASRPTFPEWEEKDRMNDKKERTMSLLPIVKVGAPILREKAEAVTRFDKKLEKDPESHG